MVIRKCPATNPDQPLAGKPSSREGRPEPTTTADSDPNILCSGLSVNTPILTNNNYTVGWVCALRDELAAAQAMLDKEHQNLPQDKRDTNTYTLGQIGQHNVVLACLGMGTTGANAAATAAANLLRSFPKVRFGLMVGIGGGAPSEPSD